MQKILSLMQAAHSHWVLGRRAEVLSSALARLIPPRAKVLDIGCGDGHISQLIRQKVTGLSIQGLEVKARPNCLIEYQLFDGISLPCPDTSFDVCLLVDVLHHTRDIFPLLGESCRVSRRYVLIKDHLCEGRLDYATLRLMDWVGNRPYNVRLPYNYQSKRQWSELFAACCLEVVSWQGSLPLYPYPASVLFTRGLHFLALLRHNSGGSHGAPKA